MVAGLSLKINADRPERILLEVHYNDELTWSVVILDDGLPNDPILTVYDTLGDDEPVVILHPMRVVS